MRRSLGLLMGLCALSCGKLLQQARADEHAPAAATGTAPSAHAAEKAEPADEHASKARSSRYALPFAWETSEAEPLAKTRAFLREMLGDNQRNVLRGNAAFKPFQEKQAPRATVLTCSDSRVQNNAWDQSPENDDFVVRNIGNQVPNALGSLAYGVEELKTPVLLVIGHTGCGAVHAAMDKLEGIEGPIKKELEGLKLPELKAGAANAMWTAAVIANVNQQVTYAVEHFGQSIQEGNLTVIGAVYDFRNDMRGGAGKLHVVNVNSNTEPERLKAFSTALLQGASAAPAPGPSPFGFAPLGDTPVLPLPSSVPKTAPPRPSPHAH